MKGDEARTIRRAEMIQAHQQAADELSELYVIVNTIRAYVPTEVKGGGTVWTVSAIQNRQSLLRAKVARLESSIADDERDTLARAQADGDDDTPDNVVVIR